MTDLKDRLDALAEAAVGDRRLVDPAAGPPETAGPPPSGPATTAPASARRHPARWLGAAAAVVLVALAIVVVVARGGDEDGPVTVGPGPSTGTPPAPPVLSVALTQDLGGDGDPLGLTVTVRDGGGDVVDERPSSDAETTDPGGSGHVFVERGLIFDLPGAGAYEVEVNGLPGAVTCRVDAAAGQRLILPFAVDGASCGAVETVEEWAHDSGEVGQAYVGLTEAEAQDRAAQDGYRARVTDRDGLGFAVTMDIAPDRLDLMVFDGVVVSAALGGEARAHTEPRVVEPLAVVFVSLAGPLVGEGMVQVRVDDEAVQRNWGSPPGGGMATGVLIDDLPPGPAELELQGGMCTLAFDLESAGTVVTVDVAPDGTVADRECPATVEPLADHLARMSDGFDLYDPAPGYVGLTEVEAEARAEGEGRIVRVVSRDGQPSFLTRDLRGDRVNLVVYDDEVRAAAIF